MEEWDGDPVLEELRFQDFRLLNRRSLVGAPVDRFGLTVLNLFVNKLVSIRVVSPSAAHPLGPRINRNLRTDRPEVLTKYGSGGHYLNLVLRCFIVYVLVFFFFSRSHVRVRACERASVQEKQNRTNITKK